MSGHLFVNNSAATTASLGNGFTLSTVPEPSTCLLIGGALLGIGILTRKTRK